MVFLFKKCRWKKQKQKQILSYQILPHPQVPTQLTRAHLLAWKGQQISHP